MSQFVESLPWRIAAVAGLIVGGVSLAVGTDLWQSLLRVGAAVVVFGLGGLGLRALLRQGMDEAAARRPGARPGAHIDQKTPPMSVEDVTQKAEGADSRGDESKQ